MSELERIRHAVEALNNAPGWNWNTFTSTLIATLVGASIAGTVALLVLRRQRRDAYEANVRDVATRALSASIRYTETVLISAPGTNLFSELQKLQAELLMLEAVGDAEDRKIAHALHASVLRVLVMPPGGSGEASGAISRGIAELVARRESVEAQLRRINSIAPNAVPTAEQ